MIKLLLHHILIKLDEPEIKTQSGIILAVDEKKERKAVEFGTVVDVGPTAYIDYGRDPSILKPGDKVTFARYAGKEVQDVDGETYVVLPDVDILAVIE